MLQLASALVLLAFSNLPLSHEPRGEPSTTPPDRPFFIGQMLRLIEPERVAFQPRETASPVLDETQSRIYLGTSDGKLRCRFRGKTSWTYQAVGSILAAPLLDGETIYVASADGVLAALNRITGEERWRFDVHEELTTTPTLAGGRLFVVSSGESVTAVDAATGKSQWKFHRDPPGGFTIRGNARPRVAHGTVFVGFADGTVAALQPEDGVARWSRNVSGQGDYLDVDSIDAREDDGHIYLSSAKTGALALDAATGETVWSLPLPGANHALADGPRVYFGGKGSLVAVDRATGKELWRLKLKGDHYPEQPAAGSGMLLVAEDRGALIALDASTGRVRGAFDPGSGFSQPALIVPGAAFIVSNGGALFALGLLP